MKSILMSCLGKRKQVEKTPPDRPSSPTQQTQILPFLDLPPELRNAIYDLTIPQNQVIPFSCRRRFIIVFPGIPHNEPALMRTHRKIRSETLEMYYSTNIFQISDDVSATSFLSSLPKDALPLIQELRIQPDQLRRSRTAEKWLRNKNSWLCCWTGKVREEYVRIGVVVEPASLARTGRLRWEIFLEAKVEWLTFREYDVFRRIEWKGEELGREVERAREYVREAEELEIVGMGLVVASEIV